MTRIGSKYRVEVPIRWEIGRKGSDLIFTVPAGTEFDVSVPRGLRWAFDPHDKRYLRAAALHDEMLLDGWSRLTAGAVFAEALKESGVGAAERLILWLAVSLWKWS